MTEIIDAANEVVGFHIETQLLENGLLVEFVSVGTLRVLGYLREALEELDLRDIEVDQILTENPLLTIDDLRNLMVLPIAPTLVKSAQILSLSKAEEDNLLDW